PGKHRGVEDAVGVVEGEERNAAVAALTDLSRRGQVGPSRVGGKARGLDRRPPLVSREHLLRALGDHYHRPAGSGDVLPSFTVGAAQHAAAAAEYVVA